MAPGPSLLSNWARACSFRSAAGSRPAATRLAAGLAGSQLAICSKRRFTIQANCLLFAFTVVRFRLRFEVVLVLRFVVFSIVLGIGCRIETKSFNGIWDAASRASTAIAFVDFGIRATLCAAIFAKTDSASSLQRSHGVVKVQRWSFVVQCSVVKV
jgi:hypothetical protein